MPRSYNVQADPGQALQPRWLYYWVGDYPVWTHDVDKAKMLSAYDAALAVGKARAAGFPLAKRIVMKEEP